VTDTVGRCGYRAPVVFPGTPSHVFCKLPAGHAGWHKADDGGEWTPAAEPESAIEARVRAQVAAEMREAEERAFRAGLAAADNAITWNTTCVGCADQLDTAVGERAAGYAEGVRDGRAQAAAETLRTVADKIEADYQYLEARVAAGIRHACYRMRREADEIAASSGAPGNPKEPTDA